MTLHHLPTRAPSSLSNRRKEPRWPMSGVLETCSSLFLTLGSSQSLDIVATQASPHRNRPTAVTTSPQVALETLLRAGELGRSCQQQVVPSLPPHLRHCPAPSPRHGEEPLTAERSRRGPSGRLRSRSPSGPLPMPGTPEQPPGHMAGPPATEPPATEPAPWPPLPCGPCIPIMLALAALAAVFLLTTAVLAERLFRRALRPDPNLHTPTLVWRPGGELWIEPTGTPRERSEDWYGSAVPLLLDHAPDPPTSGGTLEARATAPPAPSAPRSPASFLAPQTPPKAPARSSFWGPQAWEGRPQAPGLVSWAELEQRPEASVNLGGPQEQRQRPGSPDPEWGLQPRVTLEQISAFWRREGRTSVGF